MRKHNPLCATTGYVSVKKTQSSQFAFAEQAVLHAEASATTPTCTLFVAALSMDPARFRHTVRKSSD